MPGFSPKGKPKLSILCSATLSHHYALWKADSAWIIRGKRQETSMSGKEPLGQTETPEGNAYVVEGGMCILGRTQEYCLEV